MSKEEFDLKAGIWPDDEGDDKFDPGRGGEVSINYPPTGEAEKDCVDTNTLSKEDQTATKLNLKVKNTGECDITVQLKRNGADIAGALFTIRPNKKKKKSGIDADGFTITCGNCADKKCSYTYSYGYS